MALARPLAAGPGPDETSEASEPRETLEALWRLSVDQYHALAAAGVVDEDAPVELLEGLLVRRMTKHPPHALSAELTREALAALLPPGWFINGQEPLTTLDSEPEPDVIVVRGQRRDYADRHPGPDDVALVVEVADTSLGRDRGLKQRVYARAGVPVYWILNLVDRQLEVYTAPSGPTARPAYGERRDHGAEAAVPVVVGGQVVGSLDVGALLP
jgi:Uma2 family endonuclease